MVGQGFRVYEKIDVLFAPSRTTEYQPLANKLDGAVLHHFPIA